MTEDFSEEADHVLDLILAMPLAAAADIALVSAASATQVDDALEELREKEWVESTTLGWLLKEPVERFYLTVTALEAMGLSSGTWHQPGALIRLLERAPAVEWFYPAASHFQSLGPVLDFQWVDDVGFDAVVEYQEGWIILLWIGLFRSESAVAERFERIGGDLCDLAVSDSLPRPGQVCCVVPDRFQVELVLRVVRRLHMEDWVSIWCISDDTWYGAEEVLPSGGLAYQWVYRRDGKPGSLEGALHRSQWSRTGNRTVTALLARVQPAVRDAVGDRHEAHRLMRDARRAVSKTDDPREASRMLEEFTRSLAEQDANPGAAEILARVAASVRSPGIMADAAILLRAVAEWPGIPTTTASAILGENPRGEARPALAHSPGRLRPGPPLAGRAGRPVPGYLEGDGDPGEDGPDHSRTRLAKNSHGSMGQPGWVPDPRVWAAGGRRAVHRRRLPGLRGMAGMGRSGTRRPG